MIRFTAHLLLLWTPALLLQPTSLPSHKLSFLFPSPLYFSSALILCPFMALRSSELKDSISIPGTSPRLKGAFCFLGTLPPIKLSHREEKNTQVNIPRSVMYVQKLPLGQFCVLWMERFFFFFKAIPVFVLVCLFHINSIKNSRLIVSFICQWSALTVFFSMTKNGFDPEKYQETIMRNNKYYELL